MSSQIQCELQIGGTVLRSEMVFLVNEHGATDGYWDDPFEGDPASVSLSEIESLGIFEHYTSNGQLTEAEELLIEKGIAFDRYTDGDGIELDPCVRYYRPPVDGLPAIDREVNMKLDRDPVVARDEVIEMLKACSSLDELQERLSEALCISVPDLSSLVLVEDELQSDRTSLLRPERGRANPKGTHEREEVSCRQSGPPSV